TVDPGTAGRLETELRRRDVTVVATVWAQTVTLRIAVPPDDQAELDAVLAELTGGAAEVAVVGERWQCRLLPGQPPVRRLNRWRGRRRRRTPIRWRTSSTGWPGRPPGGRPRWPRRTGPSGSWTSCSRRAQQSCRPATGSRSPRARRRSPAPRRWPVPCPGSW